MHKIEKIKLEYNGKPHNFIKYNDYCEMITSFNKIMADKHDSFLSQLKDKEIALKDRNKQLKMFADNPQQLRNTLNKLERKNDIINALKMKIENLSKGVTYHKAQAQYYYDLFNRTKNDSHI